MPLKILSGIGVDVDLDGLADASFADVLLGHREVDADRIELLQRHERRARRDVLPDLDVADAEAAGERRDDRLLGDERAGALDRRRRLIAGRERGVDAAPGVVLPPPTSWLWRSRRPRRCAASPDWPSGRPVRSNRRSRPAGAPCCTSCVGFETDRHDDAADLRRDSTPWVARNVPMAGARGSHSSSRASRHRDARHGLRRGGDEAADHLRLVDEVEPRQPAGEPGEHDEDQHQNQYAFHSMHQRSRINDPIPERLSS